ncbi:DUF7123 family protein [Halohasta litorea]|uniref:DUF7123 family protein n=1 Tax=Halohasta litorea TaxID=869891 RepID=UPI003CCD47CD
MEAESESQPKGSVKRTALEAYLRRKIADGHHYFKSRKIAAETDLSAKEIGALLFQLQGSASEFSITKWGYSGGTTWYIERDSE